MDLEKLDLLSKDDMLEILRSLVSDGVLSEDRAFTILSSNVTVQMKHIAEQLHSVLCEKNHDGECNWYSEDQRTDGWLLRDHQYWVKFARDILIKYFIKPEEFFPIYSKAQFALEEAYKNYKRLDEKAQGLYLELFRTMFKF